MIKLFKYLFIFILLIFSFFKYIEYTIIVDKKIKLEKIYDLLPFEYKNITNEEKEKLLNKQRELQIIAEKKRKQLSFFENMDIHIIKIMILMISPNRDENISYLIYGYTISDILRGKNYSFVGHIQYSIDKIYYTLALMKMDLDKILALNKYYSHVDSNGKYIN